MARVVATYDTVSHVWDADGASFVTNPVSTADPQWSVLTNGDATTPEIVFAAGDVIMIES